MLDAAAFPHLLDAILSHSGADALEAFRLTSPAFRDRVDALFARRLRSAVLVSTPAGVEARTPAGVYAGLRTPPTRAMRKRCALVGHLELATADPRAAALTEHMTPASVHIACPDRVGSIPVSAELVEMEYTPGACPFAVAAPTVVITYRPVPTADLAAPCGSRACTAVAAWIPDVRAARIVLCAGALAELPEAQAGQLLQAVAGQLITGARITLVAPERIFPGTEGGLRGDAMYALVGHLFAEAHARVCVPMGPRVAAMVNVQVAKALERLQVVPAEEWAAKVDSSD
jgi:hypothetical protein